MTNEIRYGICPTCRTRKRITSDNRIHAHRFGSHRAGYTECPGSREAVEPLIQPKES